MKEVHQTKSRRRFIKDGLRTVLLGGLALMGLFLGRRKVSTAGQDSPCTIDLPCRICSRLPGCQEVEALDTKKEYLESLDRSTAKLRGPE